MKAIMYHYIRKGSKDLPYFKYLDFDNFCKQLDYFESKYNFINKEDFLEILKHNKPLKKDAIILTFDDGFIDHYRFVLPELKKRNLWGIFYLPVGVYKDNTILDVHKIHQILGTKKSTEILEFLKNILTEDMISDINNEEFRKLTYIHQDNDANTKTVKQILNYFISYKYRTEIINKMMSQFCNKCGLHEQNYMSVEQIKKMKQEGMIIGSHGVNHLVMSKLSLSEQKREIKDSFIFLQTILGDLNPKTFCYPYGGHHTFSKETEKILNNEGVLFSFNVEPRGITENDLKYNLQALPRYDCNMFPYGQVSEVIKEQNRKGD